MGRSDHSSKRAPWTGRPDQCSSGSTPRFLLRQLSGLLRNLLTLSILAWPLTVFPQTEQSAETRAAADNYPATTSRDWEGLKRDTWYFMGAQVGSLGILYLMPGAVTNWSDEQNDNFSLSKWHENISHPHLDKDDFYLNYLLHPYWGATFYVRARERGYEKLNAFWYSAFLSTFYEAGPEALFEQPSIQDLVITPVFGAWLGEYFMGVRNRVRERAKERGYRTRGETWIWFLTDPLNLINTTLARAFDKDTRLSLQVTW